MKTKIRELRMEAELTQQQIAELEKEQYNPSLMLAYRLAVVFDTTVEELCCLEENRRREEEQDEEI